jgi:versican core protein
MTWNAAKPRCEQEGGHLTSIHSTEENQFLLTLLPQNHVVWIGANDLDTEGTFVWTDGSAWDFEAWKAGEPNNHGGGEDCTDFGYGGETLWNDLPCNRKWGGFICKKK